MDVIRFFCAAASVLLLTASAASAQSIGVYFDAAGTTCSGTIPPYAPGTFYVLARLGGPAADGITGAEFRLDGVDPAWFTTAIPAGNAVIGSPHSGVPQGVNEGFETCQPGVGGYVLLYTYNVVFFSPVPETYLVIRQHTVPPNPAFQCPSLFMCDPPNLTQVCAAGGAGILNGSPCTSGEDLGIYADDMGTDRLLCAEQGVPTSFYLVGRIPVFAPPGVTGAEFRIEVTSPAGYLFNYTPPDGASSYGSPFDLTPSDPNDPAGTTVLFSSCQPASPQPNSLVDFGRVHVLNFAGGATTLRIRAKQPPDSPTMPCARFFLCDAPLYTPICMSSVATGDIVYEVSLSTNAQDCEPPPPPPPPPFTTEILQLDTHEASDDGAVGPVSTGQTLDHRRWFLLTVWGTASLTNSSSWVMPPNVVCGIPERLPQTASPGVTNYWVGADAEINFAAALPPGGDCNSLESQGYPRHHTRFQVDLGSGFTHLEPLGGAPSDPAPAHNYRFLVQGRDSLASFRWEEAQTSDNYGVLSIRVEEASPTDVDPAVESTPRPNKVLMLAGVPNPFNPTTVIRYVLPRDTEVTVEVYDIRGRAIRRLFGGQQSGGYQSVIWDGRLGSGTRASSGTYFVRVTTPVGSASERMTLVK